MMLTRPRDDQRDFFWPVFGDIALAMLLLFLLLLVLQVIESSKLEAFEVVKRRKAEVKKRLEARFSDKITISDVDKLRQRATFSSDVLFGSCRAGIEDMAVGADSLIAGVGEELNGVAIYFSGIEVEGHTDKLPPKTSQICPYDSNWELSSARATTVVRVLHRTGIDPRMLSAVGRSEFRPAQEVSDSLRSQPDHVLEVYRQNRRIEMILVYSDLVDPMD